MDYSLKFQVFISFLIWGLQHAEILNIYNCKRWYCSGAIFVYCLLTLFNYICFKLNKPIFISSFIIGLIAAGSILFWDIEHWNISTRHRNEYYDTHNFNDNILFLNLFWIIIFINQNKIINTNNNVNNDDNNMPMMYDDHCYYV